VLTRSFIVAMMLVGQAEVAEPEASKAQVRRLVRQLGHEQLTKRDEAEAALIELGPEILEKLPRGKKLGSEVDLRLGRIRDVLERVVAKAATRATRVTLKGERKLSEVFAAFESQTGNRIVDFRGNFNQEKTDPVLELDLAKATFWEALDQVLDQAKLVTYAYGGQENALAVVNREEGQLPSYGRADYAGIFRVEATQIRANRDLRNPENDMLQLALEITWEPRITPIALQQSWESVKAWSDAGDVLEISGRQGTLDATVQNMISSVEMVVPLVLPDREARSIASLKGKLTALVPGQVSNFTFAKLSKARNVEQRKAGVVVVLQQTRRNAELHEVRMLVRFDKASGALASHRAWIYAYTNKGHLIGPDGQTIRHAGFETTRQDVNEIGFSYKFVLDGDLDGYKFVYVSPTAIVRMPVEYKLTDIDLP